jgi:hypothetical protein
MDRNERREASDAFKPEAFAAVDGLGCEADALRQELPEERSSRTYVSAKFGAPILQNSPQF